jgi:two-component system KDP operon response regulator KdpE
VVVTDDFSVDLAAKRVLSVSGEAVRLTPTEWSIVELLVRNRGRLVSKREILHEVWGFDSDRDSPYLRVHVAAIRRKLEADTSNPRHFVTDVGRGYRFET